MRTVEEIQNLVFSAFENMLERPGMYMPCTPHEFEARVSSYFWVLVISENAESDWAAELELIRKREGWKKPLDVVASLKSSLSEKPSGDPAPVKSDDERLVDEVIEFYRELAQRMGFITEEE